MSWSTILKKRSQGIEKNSKISGNDTSKTFRTPSSSWWALRLAPYMSPFVERFKYVAASVSPPIIDAMPYIEMTGIVYGQEFFATICRKCIIEVVIFFKSLLVGNRIPDCYNLKITFLTSSRQRTSRKVLRRILPASIVIKYAQYVSSQSSEPVLSKQINASAWSLLTISSFEINPLWRRRSFDVKIQNDNYG